MVDKGVRWGCIMFMRFTIALCGCIGLAGCGSQFLGGSTGVATPSPETIANYVEESRNGGKITTGEYLIASVSYTDEKCNNFFDLLEKYKQDSSLIDKVILAATAASTPLSALSGASVHAVTNLTSSLLFANQINGIADQIYAFSEYKDQLKVHIIDGMKAYQSAKGLDLLQQSRAGFLVTGAISGACVENSGKFSGQRIADIRLPVGSDPKTDVVSYRTSQINVCDLRNFLNSREPSDLMIARGIAAEYASKCSLSEMRKIIGQALNNTTTKLPDTTPGLHGASTKSPDGSALSTSPLNTVTK